MFVVCSTSGVVCQSRLTDIMNGMSIGRALDPYGGTKREDYEAKFKAWLADNSTKSLSDWGTKLFSNYLPEKYKTDCQYSRKGAGPSGSICVLNTVCPGGVCACDDACQKRGLASHWTSQLPAT